MSGSEVQRTRQKKGTIGNIVKLVLFLMETMGKCASGMLNSLFLLEIICQLLQHLCFI